MSSSGGISGTLSPAGTPFTVSPSIKLPSNNLPLEYWRDWIGYHPFHFWGFAHTEYAPVRSKCNTIVTQHSWQSDDVAGRDDIREALISAESIIRSHVNFPIGRTYASATIPYPRPNNFAHQYALPASGLGRWLPLNLPEYHIRGIGIEARTIIDASASVTYSDADGDGLQETFTVTASTDVTDPDEIALYFTSGDRIDGEELSEKWRIAPVKVTISAGVVTIKGRKWMMGKPIKYEGFSFTALRAGLDLTDASNFVTNVTVARRYTKTDGQTTDDSQAVLIWETSPYPAFSTTATNLSFEPNSLDPAALGYAVARAGIRDARLGIVTVGESVYNSESSQWVGVDWGTCRQPDRVLINYVAGVRLAPVETSVNVPEGRDGGDWASAIAQLATARLPRQIATCDVANRKLWHWQFDLSRAGGLADEQFRISEDDLKNPIGTKRGEVYAWKVIQNTFMSRPTVI